MNNFHPNHIVEQSPWPLLASVGGFTSLLSIGLFWNNNISVSLVLISILTTTSITFSWAHDVFNESSNQGCHTNETTLGLKIGIILFISSEVFLFVSFFWAFFSSALAPTIELGSAWPPHGVKSFDPIIVPLMNTIILVSSGASLTWCHSLIHMGNLESSINALWATIALGIVFSFFQGIEYWNAEFGINDSAYGSTFFIATGFHGLHVIIGTTFLATCLNQLNYMNTASGQFISFDSAAWYWHFVDVVWLFLFSSMYWWGA